MRIEFLVDGTAAVFERSSATGRATLCVADEALILESPWNPSTHFAASTTKTWSAQSGGHSIVVVKKRAQWFGGIRAASFTVIVDGEELLTQHGR